MEKVIVITPAELLALINTCIRTAFQEHLSKGSSEEGDILTHTQAAAYLHMSEQTLYGYCHRMEVPYFKGGGDPTRKKAPNLYSKKELLIWQQNGRQMTKEQIGALSSIQLHRKT